MQQESGGGSQQRKEFINDLAQKLGISVDKVRAALQEAGKERIDRLVVGRIKEAVQSGVINQAEADEIREWWRSRPETVKKLWLGHMHGWRRLGRRE
jgi:hypothetical protein